MHLDAGAVQPHRLHLHAHDPLPLQVLEHAVQNAVLRPAVHPRVDGVPFAEAFRQPAPLAAVLGHVEDRVEHLEVRHADVAPLNGKQRRDVLVLGLGDLHLVDSPSLFPSKTTARRISHLASVVLTRPNTIFRYRRFAPRDGLQLNPTSTTGHRPSGMADVRSPHRARVQHASIRKASAG